MSSNNVTVLISTSPWRRLAESYQALSVSFEECTWRMADFIQLMEMPDAMSPDVNQPYPF